MEIIKKEMSHSPIEDVYLSRLALEFGNNGSNDDAIEEKNDEKEN
jgi:hypothetical protein